MKAAYVEPAWVGEMARTRTQIEMRARQKASEPVKVHRSHPEDERAAPAPTLAAAIGRKARRTK